IALDAKVNLDDNALYRHPDLKELRDFDEEDPLEVEASKFSLNYIKLEGGNVGCMVNRAGLALAHTDILKLAGRSPADFLDGGGAEGGGGGRGRGRQGVSVLVGRDTRLLVQGMGKHGTFHAIGCREYGTNVIGGVTPGKGGTTVEGLPLFNSVEEAVRKTGAN